MYYFKQIILSNLLTMFLFACGNSETDLIESYTIHWDEATRVCVAEKGVYGRLSKLNNNTLLAVYENTQGDVVIKKSTDLGMTWGAPRIIYEHFEGENSSTGKVTKVNIANPEIICLETGEILLGCNLRPQEEGIYPYSIVLKRSLDSGETWSESIVLYEADTYFNNGCWEPSFLLLPDGKLHLYFANEFPYKQSDEQEISMITSDDNGTTWSDPAITVSFRKKHRDGMPVAIHNDTNIYVAIEDNVSGQFQPYIVSSSLRNAWDKPVTANSNSRYSALKKALPKNVYAGAPYLILTDNKFFIMSYQTTENRSSKWGLSTMEVVISRAPNNFENPTHPFDVPLSKSAKWNTLSDLGNNTIAAISSTNSYSQNEGIWMIKGKIVKIE